MAPDKELGYPAPQPTPAVSSPALALPARLLQPSAHAHAPNREHRPAAACPQPGAAPRPPQAPETRNREDRDSPPVAYMLAAEIFSKFHSGGEGRHPSPGSWDPPAKF